MGEGKIVLSAEEGAAKLAALLFDGRVADSAPKSGRIRCWKEPAETTPREKSAFARFRDLPMGGEWIGVKCGHSGRKGPDFYITDENFCKACLKQMKGREGEKHIAASVDLVEIVQPREAPAPAITDADAEIETKPVSAPGRKRTTRVSMAYFSAVPAGGEWTGLTCGHTGIKGKDFYDYDQHFCKDCCHKRQIKFRKSLSLPFESVEAPAEKPPVASLGKDKWGKLIKECAECHELRGIIGRGRCAKCYWHLPEVREKLLAKRKGCKNPVPAPVTAVNVEGRPEAGVSKGTKHRLYPPWTPEQDAEIRAVYENQVGKNRRDAGKPVAELAEKLNQPRWRISKRAFDLAAVPTSLKRKKEPPWSEAEYKILRENAAFTLSNIQQKFKAAGFDRSRMAIKIKINRTLGRKPKAHYTGTSLSKRFGIDSHSISNWIQSGFLKAAMQGNKRTARQGGDSYVIQEADVRQFVIENVEVVDFRKVDKFWLVELLTANPKTVQHGDDRQSQKSGAPTGKAGREGELTGPPFEEKG